MISNFPSPDKWEYFWSKVDIGGHDDCWEWQMGFFSFGYGYFTYTAEGIKVNAPAHRLAYLYVHPDWDQKLCLCHSCDNPKCCNPSHLWLGTREDNNRDKLRKGRGGHRKNRKLSDQDRRDLKDLRASGKKVSDLAKLYRVSLTTIYRVTDESFFFQKPIDI